jgi:hypothetical protein
MPSPPTAARKNSLTHMCERPGRPVQIGIGRHRHRMRQRRQVNTHQDMFSPRSQSSSRPRSTPARSEWACIGAARIRQQTNLEEWVGCVEWTRSPPRREPLAFPRSPRFPRFHSGGPSLHFARTTTSSFHDDFCHSHSTTISAAALYQRPFSPF